MALTALLPAATITHAVLYLYGRSLPGSGVKSLFELPQPERIGPSGLPMNAGVIRQLGGNPYEILGQDVLVVVVWVFMVWLMLHRLTRPSGVAGKWQAALPWVGLIVWWPFAVYVTWREMFVLF